MKEIAQKIKELCAGHGVPINKMLEICGLNKNFMYDLERRNTSPSIEKISKIADFFKVSVDELLGTPIAARPFKNQADILPIKRHRIPLLGSIAAGEPIYADEDRESYVECGTDIKADFCLKVRGDSMTGARIHDGDIVFVRTQEMVNNGEIAAVCIDDEATLKRVHYDREKNILTLMSENSAYQPLVYVNGTLDQVRILGKAIAFQSDIK